MTGKHRRYRAIHEAAHAVIGRKFGLPLTQVNALASNPMAEHASAAYLAESSDMAAQIAAYEQDAIIALAGYAANRRDHPHLHVFNLFANDDADTTNAASAIYKSICLKLGQPIPQVDTAVEIDQTKHRMMEEVYLRLVRETKALVDQHWPAIMRLAKYLETHDSADQATVDDLIERAERRV